MKSLLLSAAAVLAALSSVSLHAQAPEPAPVQSQTGEPAKGGKGADKAAKGKDRLEKMKTDLGLTDDQAKKVQEVMAGQKEKMKAVKDDASLSKEQKMEKMKAGRAEVDAAIGAILTPEQKAKWDTMKKDRPAKPAAQ
jgi:Spy/CpxP family protein refolding chaperone